MTIDQQYAARISLAADRLWVSAAKAKGFKDTALFFSREAQRSRRQLAGA